MDDRSAIAERLRRLVDLDRPRAQSDAPPIPWFDPDRLATRLVALHARVLLEHDRDWPAGLRALADPPRALFARGAIPDWSRAVAIVGSRAATRYGIEQARRLAFDLAGLGFTVVSGLARGIDAAAHRGALEAGGITIAVLPGGLDEVTPRHHRMLAEEIAERGALVTEIPTGAPVFPGLFVKRNRLIAALAAATVVAEAAERSGALSTASAARRIDRPLLAIPGDVDRPTSAGCHHLIRSGARLCAGVADVLAVLETPLTLSPRRPRDAGPRHVAAARARGSAAASSALNPEARLLAALAPEPAPLESLSGAAGLTVDRALAALLGLEWSGLAVAHPGQRWARATTLAP